MVQKRKMKNTKRNDLDDQLLIIKNFIDEFFIKTMFQNSQNLTDTDLSPSQIKILFAFEDEDNAHAIGELAAKTRVKKSTITYIIDRLEIEGIVERIKDSKDRRIVKVRLTSKAKENKRKFHLRGRQEMQALFSKLSDEEKKKLLSSLEGAYKILSKI